MSHMTYEQIVRAAKSPAEALIALARALDEADANADEGWGAWPAALPDDTPRPAYDPPRRPEPDASAYDVIPVEVDQREVQRLQEQVHQAEIDFEKARADGDLSEEHVNALKAAQARLRLAEDPGAILQNSGEVVGGDRQVRTEGNLDGSSHIIDLPPAEEHRKQVRRQLAEAIDLPGFFEPIMRGTEEQRQQLIETYVKGGPLWLWPRRDIMAALPPAAKRVMVADVMQDSNRIGWDFGRDILKDEMEEGTGLAVAMDNLNGVIDAGGTPYQGRD